MQSSRRLARFLRPYRRWAVLAPLMMVLEVALDLIQPRLIQRIVDQGIARHDLVLVIHTGTLMVGLALVGTAGGILCGVFAVMAAQGVGTDLRRALFVKVQAFSFGNLDELETGPLITRLTNDVNQIQELVMILLRVMVRAPLLLIGSLIMAILTSPMLSLLFLPLISAVLLTLILVIRRTYPLFGDVQRRLDMLNTVLQENLAGVRVVKAFARAAHEIKRFRAVNDHLTAQNTAVVRLSALTMPVMMLTLNLGVVAALWIGGVRVTGGSMQVGQVIAFVSYLMETLMSLLFASMLVVQVSRAEASAQRVLEVLDSEPSIKTAADSRTDFVPQGRVAFENVTFCFGSSEHAPVLKDISFVAEPGQTVAILGATGAGKSSLVNLIPRLYDVSQGRVTIDGTDVRTIDERALRGQVGIALQEAVLFSGTVRDNIRYGRPEASEDEVIAAARMAQADEFISHLPGGYDAVVGRRGVNLSGGQKQRIAIARALLTRPTVLILDDSTSAVDVRTEARIHEALAESHAGQTRLIVAQRISTVSGADKILVLEDGMIVAEGPHDVLVQSSPIYREIYESQAENGVIAHGGE